MKRKWVSLLAGTVMLTLMAVPTVQTGIEEVSAGNRDDKILEFDTMVGVPRPFTGGDNAIRGVPGGGLPWVIDKGVGELRTNGHIRVKVEGLVIDPNDPQAIAVGRAGTNPVSDFKAIVSCLSKDGMGNTLIVNEETDLFPADEEGNSEIRDNVDLPDPCIAPIIFVTSPGGSWFSATGF